MSRFCNLDVRLHCNLKMVIEPPTFSLAFLHVFSFSFQKFESDWLSTQILACQSLGKSNAG
jgi:hypothetical protein